MSKRVTEKGLSESAKDEKCEDWKTLTPEERTYAYFYFENPRAFRRRYALVIGADLLAGCFTIAMTAVLLLLTSLSRLPENLALKICFLGSVATGLVLFFSKAQVNYGRIRSVWISVGIYLICLLISLPAITYRPPLFLYTMSLLSPLTGLLILNSNRCRELRHKMVEIRRKREDIIATLKKQGRWKWW
ncbi:MULTISPECIES: hypothetical protein [Pseudomonas]|uniref:Uncharacterized protein n=1 Tax=Pseudomonas salomonii TaxID=191391 RepID=A0A1H3V333_9PSED|nr:MULTISPECIES: hypothetical protein [Pseudomonas]CRM16041.1 hypothetical protein [Pseudomonas sp. 58 R 3]SDZ68998.1 hypothetical protein SAMN05216247_12325 [Pseudomonas salomonii]